MSDMPSDPTKLLSDPPRIGPLTRPVATLEPEREPVFVDPEEEARRFLPREPRTWEETGLDPLLVEQLVLRYLLAAQSEAGRQIAAEVCIHFNLMRELFEALKAAKFIQHRTTTATGDFIYELTEAGRHRAMDYRRLCAYVGPAPVPFGQYLAGVRQQSLANCRPGPEDLERGFADLHVAEEIVGRLGPAITGGQALFLHGEPGNGKTSIAERITRCFGDTIWIPSTLIIDGHIVKLYDPASHEAVDVMPRPNLLERIDRRWVRIRRPTVLAGGELTLDMLEIQVNATTNLCEAPLQLKANCGTLVIDDFGRQRIPAQELLNRWIYPLERRIDFLRLPDGRKISAPFDALLVFSTNLEPKDLVDEAFLRRIPYKIRVDDPTPEQFRVLLETLAGHMDIVLPPGSVPYLMERHYRQAGRPMRFCHPRDLLLQISHQCAFERRRGVAAPSDWDRAVSTYFGAM